MPALNLPDRQSNGRGAGKELETSGSGPWRELQIEASKHLKAGLLITSSENGELGLNVNIEDIAIRKGKNLANTEADRQNGTLTTEAHRGDRAGSEVVAIADLPEDEWLHHKLFGCTIESLLITNQRRQQAPWIGLAEDPLATNLPTPKPQLKRCGCGNDQQRTDPGAGSANFNDRNAEDREITEPRRRCGPIPRGGSCRHRKPHQIAAP